MIPFEIFLYTEEFLCAACIKLICLVDVVYSVYMSQYAYHYLLVCV